MFKNYFLIIFVVFFQACEGPIGPTGKNGIDGNNDKQVRLRFGGDMSTSSTTWRISQYETWYLLKFNKHNYANVDSIVFSCSMYTSNTSNKCIAQLYNVTDTAPIENTTLESNIEQYIFVESGNIYNSLPDNEITLAVSIRSENEGFDVATGIASYLFLYRD